MASGCALRQNAFAWEARFSHLSLASRTCGREGRMDRRAECRKEAGDLSVHEPRLQLAFFATLQSGPCFTVGHRVCQSVSSTLFAAAPTCCLASSAMVVVCMCCTYVLYIALQTLSPTLYRVMCLVPFVAPKIGRGQSLHFRRRARRKHASACMNAERGRRRSLRCTFIAEGGRNTGAGAIARPDDRRRR